MRQNTVQLYILPIRYAEGFRNDDFVSAFPNRFARSKRFAKKEDALCCLAGGILLHRILGLSEKDLKIGKHGKPFCETAGCFFNLSHSGDYAVLARAPIPVGVDIQVCNAEHLSLAKKVFQPEEQAWMNMADSLRRFYTLWTIKEAVCKLDGRGFSLSPSSFSALPATNGEAVTIGSEALFVRSVPFFDCMLSVSTIGKIEGLELYYLTKSFIEKR